MKHFFLLVLIPLALLVVGASPSPTPSKALTPNHTVQRNEQCSLPQQQGAQHPAPSALANLARGPEKTPNPDGEGDERQRHSLLTIGTFVVVAITGIATALIAIFTCQLVRATRDMHELSKRVFESNRPVLAISHLIANESPLLAFRPIIEFQNCGENPAIVIRAVAATRPCQRQPPEIPMMPEYDKLLRCAINRSVLGAGDKAQISWGYYLLQSDAERIPFLVGEKHFALYGVVHYRMASEPQVYETYFNWFYSPPSQQLLPEGGFYIGPESYNRQT